MAQLHYLGKLVDFTGVNAETRELPATVTTTAALRKWLDEIHDCAGTLSERAVRIAINNAIVSEPADVTDEDEIAFMPPVGGG